MKIVVCLKQVPDTEANIKIGSDQKSVVEAGMKFIINPFDEFAIEEALKKREAGTAESITVVAMGPERTRDALRSSLELEVNEALHLVTEDDCIDGLAVAKVLAEQIKSMDYGLILMGKEAIDDGNMQVGPMLGELLGIPCISLATRIDIEGDKVTVKRNTDSGVEILESPLPCIITCEKGLNEPRYPSIRGKMKAKKMEIPQQNISLGTAGVEKISMTYPEARSGGRVIGEGPDAVAELVRVLKEEAQVI
ncbi:electron transfer flavoprotein subunit beta/FixA family protein [candidate division KSB1 bacterium]|nr:electron transfer flavoprotein subunit beta/FixA family protein [candidate division KSB1 bacterium]